MVHPLYDLVARPLEQLAERVEQVLDDNNRRAILGPRMLKTLGTGSPRVLIKLALINDCLRVIEGVIGADATAARRRLLSAYPLLRAIAGYYARLREDYRPFERLTPDVAARFVKFHYRDPKLFGNACERTRWLGRDVCHRSAVLTQQRDLLESYERITGALLAHLLGPDATRVPAQPPPDQRTSDSAIRRYQGFDVEDAEDHIDVPAAAVAPTLPMTPAAPSAPPLPPEGHYLLPEGEGFTLRHGRLQIEYRPAGARPGHVSTDFVDEPPSGEGWLSLAPDHFETLRAQVLAELRKVVETGGEHELPPLDPLNVEPEPPEEHETIPLAPEDEWSPEADAARIVAEAPAAEGSDVPILIEEVSDEEAAVAETPELVAVAEPPDIPLAMPVTTPVDADVPLATPVLPAAAAVATPTVPANPVTRLAWAAVEGLPEHVLSALDDGAEVDALCADHDQTALMLAAERGHLAVVTLLLDRGAETDRTDAEGRTAWTLAAAAGHVPVAALLAQRGAELRPDDALASAVREGDLVSIDRLLNAGADPYASLDGWNALTTAAALGRDDVLENLLNRGVDVNAGDEHGRTAWVAARANGHAATAALLERHGAAADVGAALVHAAHAGNADSVRELLAAGADPNATATLGEEGVGALEAVLRGAAAAGADPFDSEATQQWLRCVEALLDAGLDVDRTTANARPLLVEAVVLDRPEVAVQLIARGADLEARDLDGTTALIHAASGGHLETVRALLAAGAQPDAREPRSGRTALLAVCAARVPRGRVVASWLLAYGAAAQLRGRDGKSATDLARAAYSDAAPEESAAALLDDREAVSKLAGALVNPPQTAKDFARRGETYRHLGDHAAAAADFEEAIRLEPAKSSTGSSNWYDQRARAYAEQGEQGPTLALECGKLGRAYVTSGLLSGTLACYGEAMRLDPRYAWPFNNLAWQLTTWPVAKLRDGPEAVRLATTACEQSGWRCWSFLDTLAAAQASAGHSEEAVRAAEKALALAPPDQHSSIRHQLAQYQAGKPWQPDTPPPAIRDELPPPPAELEQAERGPAAQLLAEGNYAEAEAAARQAAAETEERLGSTHALLSPTLRHLGLACLELGRTDEAEKNLKRALLIAERSCGLSHPLTLAALDALAQFCFRQDRDLEASCLLRRLATLQEQTLGRDTPATAATLETLGRALWAQSRLAEAAEALEQALAVRRALPEADRLATAGLIHHLGRLYFGLDRDAEAARLYTEALTRMEQESGPGNAATSDVLCDLAELHRFHGRAEEAVPLLQQALAVREAVLGPDHEQVAQVRTSLQELAGG